MHMHIHTHMQALFRIPRDPPPRLAEPSAWSADFAHWLSCTLQKEPERRVDAATLRSHPFAAGAGDAAAQRTTLQPLAAALVAAYAHAAADASDARP